MIKSLVKKTWEFRVLVFFSLAMALLLLNNIVSTLALFILVFFLMVNKSFHFTKSKLPWFTIIFFSYVLARELCAMGIQNNISEIIRLLPILIVPFSILDYSFNEKETVYIPRIIILVNFILYLIALFFGFLIFLDFHTSNNPLVFNLSHYQWLIPIKMGFHPPFWGLYIVLSTLFISVNDNVTLEIKKLFICVSFVFLIFLASRTALIIFIISHIIVLLRSYRKRINLKQILTLLVLTVCSAFLVKSSDYLTSKIYNKHGFSDRKLLWETGVDLLVENPIFGVSFSKYESSMEKKFALKNVSRQNYDPHNLFIYFGGSIGLIGLLLFLFIFLFDTKYKLNSIYLVFIVVFILSISTETIFNRQMGVAIYSIYLGLFKKRYLYKKQGLTQ
ncbi:O-antigen ligase family protein [Flagellimonas sp. S174]|uniref:O-antigen ligase family protein n=1 Tax=Flagellimonas sp. S174 TaxID=3410790 RepID=UPI003BF4D53F